MSRTSCEIETKVDFLTGMYLIVRIDEHDVDENALHTIQDDCPDFILPFNYRIVNGQMELTYKVGQLCRLQYFYGDITYGEYASLWKSLLSPLLECSDWFMNTCNFILDIDYLYYDKNKQSIAYVYVPCKSGCSGFDAFKEMAIEVAKNIKVADPVLENNVLRSIINDFNPGEFLRMLLDYMNRHETSNFSPNGAASPVNMDISPVSADNVNNKSETGEKNPSGFKLFSGKSKRKASAKRNGYKNTLLVNLPVITPSRIPDPTTATQETRTMMTSTGFRYTGHSDFPPTIPVEITDGEIFTIGRHDTNAGKKRSNFEFDTKTKAISRRHAAIERYGGDYKIIDLSSSAGTYVDEKKLPPNTPAPLEPGCRVSFGNLGADYVWDVN